MNSLSLKVPRVGLLQALKGLGVVRRKRSSSTVPVWLSFDPEKKALSITEARGRAIGIVPAEGNWTPAGATIDMYMLRRALETLDSQEVELIVADGEILIPTPNGHVGLKLLPFGPESRRVRPLGI